MLEQFGGFVEAVKRLQQQVDTIQENLKNEQITVDSGDVIKITVNGQQEILAIDINSKYLSPENAPLLQNLLVAALNNALSKSKDINQAAMNKLAGDLNLPKLPGLF